MCSNMAPICLLLFIMEIFKETKKYNKLSNANFPASVKMVSIFLKKKHLKNNRKPTWDEQCISCVCWGLSLSPWIDFWVFNHNVALTANVENRSGEVTLWFRPRSGIEQTSSEHICNPNVSVALTVIFHSLLFAVCSFGCNGRICVTKTWILKWEAVPGMKIEMNSIEKEKN